MSSEANSGGTSLTFRILRYGSVRKKSSPAVFWISVSEKWTRRVTESRMVTPVMVGTVLSYSVLRMELGRPGVPPEGSTEEFQFHPPAQGQPSSIISNDQPPSCLTFSVCHVSLKFT